MHRRPSRPRASTRSSRRWRARRCRRCPSRRAFRQRISADCGPSVFAYGTNAGRCGRRRGRDRGAHRSATRTISTAGSIRPTKACAMPWIWRRRRSKPIVIADTQDNPGAGGDSDTTGMLRALVRNKAHRGRDRRDLRSASAKAAHAAGVGATVTLALGGKSGIPGDAPYQESFVVEQLSDGQFVAPGPYFGGREMDMGPSACLRIGDVRVVVELAQGAARRSGDVPLCRHRADRADRSSSTRARCISAPISSRSPRSS